MNAYIYQADLYCERCTRNIALELGRPGDLGTVECDSDELPQGPYGDGGGEADSFKHCALCEVFLDNPVTDVGIQHAIESMQEYLDNRTRGRPEILDDWADTLTWYNLDESDQFVLDLYLEVREGEERI